MDREERAFADLLRHLIPRWEERILNTQQYDDVMNSSQPPAPDAFQDVSSLLKYRHAVQRHQSRIEGARQRKREAEQEFFVLAREVMDVLPVDVPLIYDEQELWRWDNGNRYEFVHTVDDENNRDLTIRKLDS